MYLETCYNCLLVSVLFIFLLNLSKFLHWWSCQLWTKTVLSSFTMYTILNFLMWLIALTRISSTFWKGVVIGNIFALLLSEKAASFRPLTVMLVVHFKRYPLASWPSSTLFLVYSKFLAWIGVGFCQSFFFIYWYYHVTFLACWCDVLY